MKDAATSSVSDPGQPRSLFMEFQCRARFDSTFDVKAGRRDLIRQIGRKWYLLLLVEHKVRRPFDKAARAVRKKVSCFVGEGDLVFDIGANIGAKAEAFADSGALVVCLEPQPKCVHVLRKKFSHRPKVTIIPKGVGAAPGTMKLQVCSQASTITTFAEDWKKGRFADYKWDQEVAVEMTTLDELVAQFGVPRYCKIDVEGFESQVLAGLSRTIGYISFEYTWEFQANAAECLERLRALGYDSFNLTVGEDPSFVLPRWQSSAVILEFIASSSDPLLWGDIWVRPNPLTMTPENPIGQLERVGLARRREPLRLHLGCREKRFGGYVNFDYPPSQHNVMDIQADVFADVMALDFPSESVDEIRLHHLFEHFNRVTALAMLIKWQSWLKVGGIIHIETPDILGSAKVIASNAPFVRKMRAIRHLAGDQCASWGYHLDHWFPERFQHTLGLLGFNRIQTKARRWSREPYLCNVDVTARKESGSSSENLLAKADEILWQSAISEDEKATVEVWRRQLRERLEGSLSDPPINVPVVELMASASGGRLE